VGPGPNKRRENPWGEGGRRKREKGKKKKRISDASTHCGFIKTEEG